MWVCMMICFLFIVSSAFCALWDGFFSIPGSITRDMTDRRECSLAARAPLPSGVKFCSYGYMGGVDGLTFVGEHNEITLMTTVVRPFEKGLCLQVRVRCLACQESVVGEVHSDPEGAGLGAIIVSRPGEHCAKKTFSLEGIVIPERLCTDQLTETGCTMIRFFCRNPDQSYFFIKAHVDYDNLRESVVSFGRSSSEDVTVLPFVFPRCDCSDPALKKRKS